MDSFAAGRLGLRITDASPDSVLSCIVPHLNLFRQAEWSASHSGQEVFPLK